MRLETCCNRQIDCMVCPQNQKEYWFTATTPRDNISLLKVHTEQHDIYAER